METAFRKSSYSGQQNNCVEVAVTDDGMRLVRDTKNRDGGMLHITPGAWHMFIAAVKRG
jgi:hypothetical protein